MGAPFVLAVVIVIGLPVAWLISEFTAKAGLRCLLGGLGTILCIVGISLPFTWRVLDGLFED